MKRNSLYSHKSHVANTNWQGFSVLLLQNCSKDINLKDSSNLSMEEAEYDSPRIIRLRKNVGPVTNTTNLRQWRILAWISHCVHCYEVLRSSSKDRDLQIFNFIFICMFSYVMKYYGKLNYSIETVLSACQTQSMQAAKFKLSYF